MTAAKAAKVAFFCVAGAIAVCLAAAMAGGDPWRDVFTRYAHNAAAPPRDSVTLHYAPAENLEQIDTALIASATRSIAFAAYVLTDVPVIEALSAAAARGVTVTIWREASERPPPPAIAAALAGLEQPTVTQFTPQGRPLMHLKSYCIDGVTLRTGSANFSAAGLRRQDNDLIVITASGACDALLLAMAAAGRMAR